VPSRNKKTNKVTKRGKDKLYNYSVQTTSVGMWSTGKGEKLGRRRAKARETRAENGRGSLGENLEC